MKPLIIAAHPPAMLVLAALHHRAWRPLLCGSEPWTRCSAAELLSAALTQLTPAERAALGALILAEWPHAAPDACRWVRNTLETP